MEDVRYLPQNPKPLLWDKVKRTQRFSFLREAGALPKVVHLVVDDRMAERNASSTVWHVERLVTRLGVEGARQWLEEGREWAEDDLFISGDVDEVMSREALHQLRWVVVRGWVCHRGDQMSLYKAKCVAYNKEI